jgi:mannose-6-phosphate isomerase
MTPYPLVFLPLIKPKVWGGRTLERLGKALPAGELIGESWEIADLPTSIPGGRSTIANGELAGQTLHDALRHASWIMGDAPRERATGGFPLLIKYLDARQNLSVQVHPSPEYAAKHPEAHLKSEAWVVVDAEPGAVIYKGLRPGVTRETFAQHIRSGAVVDDLVAVPVHAGDCHYLPSGTCHALGGGIVVAEVQTPSDTTFRVYDWGRTGAGRELHIAQALECIDFSGRPHKEPSLPQPNARGGITTTPLTRTDFFEIERVDAEAGSAFEVVTSGLPQVWMMLAGEGAIAGGLDNTTDASRMLRLRPGVTALIPAAAASWRATFAAASRLLVVRLPSPLRRMLA